MNLPPYIPDLETLPTTSTGSPKEPLPQSKTKDNVDHAGPSPPPEDSKECTSLPKTPWLLCLNLNWSIAHPHTETKDVTEDWWEMPSTTLKPTVSPPKPPTLTLPETKPAKPSPPCTKSEVSPESQEDPPPPYKALWTLTPSQSPLMLITGLLTEAEYSLTAELLWTTVSWLSVIPANIG